MQPDTIDKFQQRIIKTDGCWTWKGAKNLKGYGHLWVKGKNIGAHRISYMLYKGDIPNGMVICHRCDNPTCVNPDHLFLGTQKDNISDRDQKGHTAKGDRSGKKTKPERIARGENNGSTKLTTHDVLTIRDLWDRRKFSQRAIGRMYDIHHDTVWRIVNRKNWDHV